MEVLEVVEQYLGRHTDLLVDDRVLRLLGGVDADVDTAGVHHRHLRAVETDQLHTLGVDGQHATRLVQKYLPGGSTRNTGQSEATARFKHVDIIMIMILLLLHIIILITVT